ncbi:hypothetical protein BJ085DRAFT_31806 [Dimargaris cristalligena]|uniref:LIM zinc-binding domain-containing protein n=1 Tax=Dimargaris cristalligena TaxID=215637 RepID=A0A4P9ZLN9_9FUNG|nr:hypothetical protein BJ085DRAFT_31806 [Dimargaris cristalligena]|eukprot:RKP34226.1 hypothetical protein BJ085DRAFT_31806 [Dimargaris cristalligena]
MPICTICGDLIHLNKCRCGRRGQHTGSPASASSPTSAAPVTPTDQHSKGDPWSSTYLNRLFGESNGPGGAGFRRPRPISMPPNSHSNESARTSVASSPTLSVATRDSADTPPATASTSRPRSPPSLSGRVRALTSVPKSTRPFPRSTKAPSFSACAVAPRPSETHHYTHNAYCPQPTMRNFPPPNNSVVSPKPIRSVGNGPLSAGSKPLTPPSAPIARSYTSSPKAVAATMPRESVSGGPRTADSPMGDAPAPRSSSAVEEPSSMKHNGVSRVAVNGSLEDRRQCIECHKSLLDTERQTSPLRPGAIYCDDCYSHSFSKGFCQTCKRLILTHGRPWVQYKDRAWHKMCLGCVVCGKLLLAPVVDMAGNPCCEGCFTVPKNPRAQPRPLNTNTAAMPIPIPAGGGKSGSLSQTGSSPHRRSESPLTSDSLGFADPAIIPPYQKRLSSSPRSPLAIVMQAHPLPPAHGKTDRGERRSSVDTSSLCLPSKLPASHRLSISENIQHLGNTSGASPSPLDPSPLAASVGMSAEEKTLRPDSGLSDIQDSVASTNSADASTLTPPTPVATTPSRTTYSSPQPLNKLIQDMADVILNDDKSMNDRATPVDHSIMAHPELAKVQPPTHDIPSCHVAPSAPTTAAPSPMMKSASRLRTGLRPLPPFPKHPAPLTRAGGRLRRRFP